MAVPEPQRSAVLPFQERALIAALNNAWWCRSVCAARGDAGEMESGLWAHVAPVPRFYPNAVTLEDGSETAMRLRGLFGEIRDRPWSVKDSFAALDLAPLGCRVLFDAQWLWLEPTAASEVPAGWERIMSADGLREWERAWDDGDSAEEPPIFVDRLLADDSVAIWGWRPEAGSTIAAGGITSRSPGAVGLSNCFSRNPLDLAASVDALSRLAVGFAPGHPQVGYERAEDCDPYIAIGFEAVGPLRIWIKD